MRDNIDKFLNRLLYSLYNLMYFSGLPIYAATVCGFAQGIVQSKADHYNIIGELKNVPLLIPLSRLTNLNP